MNEMLELVEVRKMKEESLSGKVCVECSYNREQIDAFSLGSHISDSMIPFGTYPPLLYSWKYNGPYSLWLPS